MGWFSRRTDEPVIPPPALKGGFQVGDRVIAVRNPDDSDDTVDDFREVYGRVGVIAEKPCSDDSAYDYTVSFPGYNGWSLEGPHKDENCWGIYHKNLRRVSKRDERPA